MSDSEPPRCPVCRTALSGTGGHPNRRNLVARRYDCPRCGRFCFSPTAEATVPPKLAGNRIKIAIFSHTLHKMQAVENWPFVSSSVAEQIIETANLPSPFEQADSLIRWLGSNASAPGERIPISAAWHGAIIGAASEAGFAFIVEGLLNEKLIDGDFQASKKLGSCMLTFAGWRRYEELQRGTPSGRVAFMAMQFGDAVLDRILNDHLRPAVTQTGFTLRRLDDTPKAGLIDDRLRVEIQGARFLIVDLTHANRGAYWEAGYAEGLGKPVIYVCEQSKFATASHFDTNHHLTVLWTEAAIDDAAKRLKATIRATIPEAKREDD